MIIQQYIQEVLFGQQVCVVPRVGTFTLERIPARYHAADRTLTPPQQLIAFSPLADTEDDDCLRWIAQKENLLDYAAEIRLNKALEEILAPLAEGRTVTIEGIGDLSQDAHGHISFVPATLPGNMDTLSVQPQTDYVPQPVTETAASADTEETGEAFNETISEIDNTGGDTWETEPERRIRWWWIAIPVMIIAGLTAAGIWWYTTQGDQPVVETPVKPAVDSSLTQQASIQDSAVVATPDTTAITPADARYKIVFQTWARKDSAMAYARYKQVKTLYTDAVIYPAPDTAFYFIALPSAAVDTASTLDKMRSYQHGKIFIE